MERKRIRISRILMCLVFIMCGLCMVSLTGKAAEGTMEGSRQRLLPQLYSLLYQSVLCPVYLYRRDILHLEAGDADRDCGYLVGRR